MRVSFLTRGTCVRRQASLSVTTRPCEAKTGMGGFVIGKVTSLYVPQCRIENRKQKSVLLPQIKQQHFFKPKTFEYLEFPQKHRTRAVSH